MSPLTLRERPMAKRRVGRPNKPGGEGKPLRVDADLATMGRAYAQYRGLGLGEYVSAILRPQITRDYARMMNELAKQGASEGGAK
jgi:hypothetical protein